MRKTDINKGTKVKIPSGEIAKVTSIEVEETGKRGRPATLFTVAGGKYRAKDLRPATAE